MATATPSATSALRRSAVPNCMETDVEDEPGHEHALREVDADVRLARSRGRVPVDPAVVARDVRTHHRELRARAEEIRAEVSASRDLHPRPIETSSAFRRPSAMGPARTGRSGDREARRRSSSRSARRADAREVELRRRDCSKHLVEDRVRGHLLRERLVRQDEPVSQRVAGKRLRSSTTAYSRPRISARRVRLNEADRAARARAARDVLRDVQARAPRDRGSPSRCRPRSYTSDGST